VSSEQHSNHSDESSENESLPSSSEKKKRGRPPGSKTQQLPVVDVERETCRACGKTNSEHLATIRTMEYTHDVGGQSYTHVRFQRRRCRDCGAVFITRQHLNL
jgi:ribosomal protein S27AE